MVIQRPQAKITPRAIDNTKEASGIAQQFNVTVREPQTKIMPPNKDSMKESDGFSRGQDVSASGLGTTVPSHLIQDGQEKTRGAQWRGIAKQHSKSRVLPLLNVGIERWRKHPGDRMAYRGVQALRHHNVEHIQNLGNCLAS
jgi:hypothetical protein